MSQSTRLLVVLACAVGALLMVAALQWNLVGSAQTKVAADVNKMAELVYLRPKATAAPPSVVAQAAAAQAATLRTHQVALAAARNATAVLVMLAMFLACFAVAYCSSTIWPSVGVAALGWVANGIVVGMLTRQAFALVATPPAVRGVPVTTMAPSPNTPIALYVVIGLAATLLWQTLLPWLLGWFLGSRVRQWRSFAVDYGSTSANPGPVPQAVMQPERRRCACGAVNLPTAGSCYACGAALGVHELATPDGSQTLM